MGPPSFKASLRHLLNFYPYQLSWELWTLKYKFLLGMQRYWAALCGYCASQHACRGLSHLLSVIKLLTIFSHVIFYIYIHIYDVRQPMTYSFLGVFSSNHLKSFQHPSASSTCGYIVSNLPFFFPALYARCDELIQHLLSHPRFSGFVAFSMGFCKSISLTVPKATEIPCSILVLGSNFCFLLQ